MLKKILIVIGVVSASYLWWLGFEKLMDKKHLQPDEINESMGFPGR